MNNKLCKNKNFKKIIAITSSISFILGTTHIVPKKSNSSIIPRVLRNALNRTSSSVPTVSYSRITSPESVEVSTTTTTNQSPSTGLSKKQKSP